MRALILVLLVVMASGCTLPGFPNVFGSDAVNVQQKVVENGVKDVIVVKDIQTIPTSPLLPSQQLLLSFIIENRDALKSSIVSVDLFDAPTMRDATGGSLCNLYTQDSIDYSCGEGQTCTRPESCNGIISGIRCSTDAGYYCCFLGLGHAPLESVGLCRPDQCGTEGCIILPGEEKPVTFVMRTPTESDITGIRTETKISFKTSYKFNTSLNYLVPAVNMDEVISRQRSGDKTDIAITKAHGSGPVQIDMELQGAPYIISGLDVSDPYATDYTHTNPESVLIFKIRNVGAGNLVNSEIQPGGMRIEFPQEFKLVETNGVVNEKFTCYGNNVCVNTRTVNGQELGAIPLYKDESRSSIRFAVKLQQPLLQPFQTYPVKATVNYWYELRNSKDVTINPFQNV